MVTSALIVTQGVRKRALLSKCPFNIALQHPLSELEELSSGNHDSRDRRLVMWWYETQLKEKYAAFVNAVQVLDNSDFEANMRVCTGALLIPCPCPSLCDKRKISSRGCCQIAIVTQVRLWPPSSTRSR